MRKAKIIYSELAVIRESATIMCILAMNQRRKTFIVEKKEGFRCALMEAIGLGNL
jgi:hypothetical protein